jgi:hypothetical protein
VVAVSLPYYLLGALPYVLRLALNLQSSWLCPLSVGILGVCATMPS